MLPLKTQQHGHMAESLDIMQLGTAAQAKLHGLGTMWLTSPAVVSCMVSSRHASQSTLHL